MHRTFSDEQTAAVIAAQLEHGLNSREVVEAAAAGTLPGIGDGLESFTIAESTARGMKARVVRETRVEPEDAAAELAGVAGGTIRRLAALIDRVVAAEEAKAPGDVDLERVRQAALVAERIGKAARVNGRPGRRRPAAAAPEPETDWLEQVAAIGAGE